MDVPGGFQLSTSNGQLTVTIPSGNGPTELSSKNASVGAVTIPSFGGFDLHRNNLRIAYPQGGQIRISPDRTRGLVSLA